MKTANADGVVRPVAKVAILPIATDVEQEQATVYPLSSIASEIHRISLIIIRSVEKSSNQQPKMYSKYPAATKTGRAVRNRLNAQIERNQVIGVPLLLARSVRSTGSLLSTDYPSNHL